MFLHTADLMVVFLSIVLMLRSLHVCTHARILHALIRTPLSLLPEQERENTRTHRMALLYGGQDRTNRYLLTLVLFSWPLTRWHWATIATLDRLCVSKPCGDGSRLRSPPWLSHVTSIAMSKLSSQHDLASKQSSSTCSEHKLNPRQATISSLLICESHFASRCTPRVSKWKSKETTPHRDFCRNSWHIQ